LTQEDTSQDEPSEKREPKKCEPLVLWWMPVLALAAPIIAAAWLGVSADEDALEKAAFGLVWPGIPAYFATLAVFWLGWKVELE
jgi:hypothetical protein